MRTRRYTEKGSVMLAVLMVMMIITLFGISSLKSSSSELWIARNARCYKQNIYRAEAAVMEASQVLNKETDGEKLKPDAQAWIVDGSDAASLEFDPEKDQWLFGANATHCTLFPDDESGYSVIFEGLAQGASLNMNASSHMWQYGVYGLSQICDGRAGVVAGYRKRY